MQDKNNSLVKRVGGIFLSGLIGLASLSVGAVKVENTNNSQELSCVTVSENEKKSEQYYKTKTGKCYHKGTCSCLKKSKIEISKEEIKKEDLKPCSKCCK